ncbi:MAG TPA: TlpA disulfide reductase family protein [Tepidisphaeraceae bacterium]|nr:TlpA disulfide reductase family protein [Tepidisphaeraceae bacterium]
MKQLLTTYVVVAVFALPIFAQPATTQASAVLLERIHAMKMPEFDKTRRSDQAYITQFMDSVQRWGKEKADLQAQFLAQYPNDKEADAVREDRWRTMVGTRQQDKVEAEANARLKEPGHEKDAAALYILAALSMDNDDPAKSMPRIEKFIAAHPKDPRGAELLFFSASRPGAPNHDELIERVIKDYPDSDVGRMALGAKRAANAVGQPFELEFNDVATGKHISTQSLKGKPIVVDFWATWCGPCVAEMPHMKELYAKYKDQVAFIGVSLDQPEKDGGLTALKDFIKQNEIPWPQYYQGDSWGGKFSASWGIQSVPTVFLVGADGKIVTTNARGGVEHLLDGLLAQQSPTTKKAGTTD